jgi:hypothetical protein
MSCRLNFTKLVMSSAAPASSVTAAKANQKKVGDIAARDQQHESDRREQNDERRPQISSHTSSGSVFKVMTDELSILSGYCAR